MTKNEFFKIYDKGQDSKNFMVVAMVPMSVYKMWKMYKLLCFPRIGEWIVTIATLMEIKSLATPLPLAVQKIYEKWNQK